MLTVAAGALVGACYYGCGLKVGEVLDAVDQEMAEPVRGDLIGECGLGILTAAVLLEFIEQSAFLCLLVVV